MSNEQQQCAAILQGKKAALLDLDGTLIDSNDEHALAWRDALTEAGFHVEFEAIRPLIGMGGDKLLPQLTSVSAESKAGKALSDRVQEIFLERYWDQVKALPGARALCEYLCDQGIKIVIATSADEDLVKKLINRAGIEDLILDETSSGDVEESKPDPDIVHAALDKADTDASEAIFFGDTPYDVQAATRAGVECIAVRSGGWRDEQLKGAVLIAEDPADLLRLWNL